MKNKRKTNGINTCVKLTFSHIATNRTKLFHEIIQLIVKEGNFKNIRKFVEIKKKSNLLATNVLGQKA